MILIMTNEQLFVPGNLIFVSRHDGIVGSLYFRGVDEDGRVSRGRIRLCHDCGPCVENDIIDQWNVTSGNIQLHLANLAVQAVETTEPLVEEYSVFQAQDVLFEHQSRGHIHLLEVASVPNQELLTQLVAICQDLAQQIEDANNAVEIRLMDTVLHPSLSNDRTTIPGICNPPPKKNKSSR